MLIAGVIYALVPMLTQIKIKTPWLVNLHFWAWLSGGVIMAYGVGMAGSKGMLRRTLYETAQYQPYMAVALLGGILLAIGFFAFLVNVVTTLGLMNVLSLFVPEGWLTPRPGLAET